MVVTFSAPGSTLSSIEHSLREFCDLEVGLRLVVHLFEALRFQRSEPTVSRVTKLGK